MRGSQIQFIHIQWPFSQLFSSQVQYVKTLLKSTIWNKTQARLHHDQRDGPETLSRWRKDIWKCSGQSRNFFSWLIVRSCPKQAKVENKQMVLFLVEQAKVDKENRQIKKSEGNKKSPSCESSNQTTQTKNHDWDQSTKICWDLYLLLNVDTGWFFLLVRPKNDQMPDP